MRWLAVLVLLLPALAAADPVISGSTGTYTTGDTVTISGSGFGSKDPAKPYFWIDFEHGLTPGYLGDAGPGLCTRTADADTERCLFGTHDGLNNSVGLYGTMAQDWDGTTRQVAIAVAVDLDGWALNDYSQKWYECRKINLYWTQAPYTSDKFFTSYSGACNTALSWHTLAHSGGCCYDQQPWMMNRPWLDHSDVWQTMEHYFQANSATEQNDGVWYVMTDGADAGHRTDIECHRDGYPLLNNTAFIKCENHNEPNSVPQDTTFLDNIYFDKSWARVVLCGEEDYGAVSNREPQIPISWSATEIQIVVNTGEFASEADGWIFVIDSDGTILDQDANPLNGDQGYQVTIGGTGVGLPEDPPASVAPCDSVRAWSAGG